MNAYPWLFPGGIGDLYDEERGPINELHGPVHDIRSWAQHLIRYCDGRFLSDQLFTLYIFNTIQRHDNNTRGNFFYYDKNWLGKDLPTLDELKQQIRQQDFTFISKLRYFAQTIRGSDMYWRRKTSELQSWIDFHVSRQHGPPTHFITLTCAENWWPDLRSIMADLERNVERETKSSDTKNSERIDNHDFVAMSKAVRKYPLYVNEYFMKRAKIFMDEFARNVLELEYYWGRVEFASGRGQIHLHILGIAKDKAYLNDFHRANTEEDKINVIKSYAENILDMTADVEIDQGHQKLDEYKLTSSSPLGIRYAECTDKDTDHIHLVQDAMLHGCNDYCLGQEDPNAKKCRECRFGFGKESTPNKRDTPGKPHIVEATIKKDSRGVEHFYLPRLHSPWIVQHSKTLLQTWRANADIQLLIYRSDPAIPDVGEIEAVSRYCVAYAGKRYKTTKQEIDSIQNVIYR